jgi:hypothetical protein
MSIQGIISVQVKAPTNLINHRDLNTEPKKPWRKHSPDLQLHRDVGFKCVEGADGVNFVSVTCGPAFSS